MFTFPSTIAECKVLRALRRARTTHSDLYCLSSFPGLLTTPNPTVHSDFIDEVRSSLNDCSAQALRALRQVITTCLDCNRVKTFQWSFIISNPSVHSDYTPEVSIACAQSVHRSTRPRSSEISRSPHSFKCSDQSNPAQNS